MAVLGAMARDVDVVAGVVPGRDRLDGVRIGLGAGDGLVGVGVGDRGAQLLVAQAADLPGVLLVVGQVDAEAALGGFGQLVPVVVQRGVDVDGDAHAAGPSVPRLSSCAHGGRASTPARRPRRLRCPRALALARRRVAPAPAVDDDRRAAGQRGRAGLGIAGRLHPRPVRLVAELARAAAGVRPRASRHRLRSAGLRRVRDAAGEDHDLRLRALRRGAARRARREQRRGRRQLDGRLHRHRARHPLPPARRAPRARERRGPVDRVPAQRARALRALRARRPPRRPTAAGWPRGRTPSRAGRARGG